MCLFLLEREGEGCRHATIAPVPAVAGCRWRLMVCQFGGGDGGESFRAIAWP